MFVQNTLVEKSMPLAKEQQDKCAKKIHDAGKRTEALSQKMMELIDLTESKEIQKKEDGGAGIDLALCKRITEKHGGELKIFTT